jgi:hypothetical protein
MDDTLLGELGTHITSEPLPLADISRRARQIRGRRMGARAGIALGLAGVLIAATAVAPDIGRREQVSAGTGGILGQAQAAPSGGAWCRGGYASKIGPEDVPSLRYLFESSPAGQPLTGVMARAESSNCPRDVPAELIVRFNADLTSFDGGIALTRLDDLIHWGVPGISTVQVRGVRGLLLDQGVQTLRLQWTEPDGGHWLLEASGVSREQLLSVANGLKLDRPEKMDPSLAPGFSPVAVTASARRHWQTWSATYGPEESSRVGIRVSNGPQLPWQSAALTPPDSIVRLVTVNGRPAVYEEVDNGGGPGDLMPGSLVWTDAKGITFQISAPSEAEALKLAQQLVHVAADDPRLEHVDNG